MTVSCNLLIQNWMQSALDLSCYINELQIRLMRGMGSNIDIFPSTECHKYLLFYKTVVFLAWLPPCLYGKYVWSAFILKNCTENHAPFRYPP